MFNLFKIYLVSNTLIVQSESQEPFLKKNLRSANGTQKEHMCIAKNCKSIFKKSFPIVSKSLEW